METLSALMDGMLLGLSLALIMGPILITLLQTSLEYGVLPGIAVGSGIWVSDTLFVLSTYFGVAYVSELIAWNGFEQLLGTVGGLVLFVLGLGFMLAKKPSFDSSLVPTRNGRSYLKFWLTGFFINTLNPFTVFFWVTVASTVVSGKEAGHYNAWAFYLGVMGVIIFTDSLKVYLAKAIRQRLRPLHMLRFRQISGLTLMTFGLILIVRVNFW